MTSPYITPKKERPGLAKRRQELREAAQDVDPAAETESETSGKVMGGSSTEPAHQQLNRARRNLQRMLTALKQRGESEYQE